MSDPEHPEETITVADIERMQALLMTAGAARAAATPRQLMRLQLELAPYMRGEFRETGDTTFIYEKIADIMGPDWEPTAEWRAYLEGDECQSNSQNSTSNSSPKPSTTHLAESTDNSSSPPNETAEKT